MDEIKKLKKAVRDRIKLEDQQEEQRKENKRKEIQAFLNELATQVAKMPLGTIYKLESRFDKTAQGSCIKWSHLSELEQLLCELGVSASFSKISTKEEGGWIAEVRIPANFNTED